MLLNYYFCCKTGKQKKKQKQNTNKNKNKKNGS